MFPNGSPYGFFPGHDPLRYPPPSDPYVIHFNYFPGNTKRKAMRDLGHWFLSEQSANAVTNAQTQEEIW